VREGDLGVDQLLNLVLAVARAVGVLVIVIVVVVVKPSYP
jgi:hypothetical protein